MRKLLKNKLPATYLTDEARQNTVAIWGSSKDAEILKPYYPVVEEVVKGLLERGKKVVHGCGSNGIMGCIYHAAEKYSPKDAKGKPLASLALLVNPRWGDEDLEHCTPVAEAASERERVALFRQMTDTFIIFPGSVATLQEVSTLIARNYYGGEDKNIIFMIDKDFFQDYVAQYDKLYKAGLISRAPDTLFRLAKSADEVLQAIDKAAEEKVVRVFE